VFWPQPDVESAVVRLEPRERWERTEFAAFTATVKTLFGQRRKTLGTQLRRHFDLDSVAAAAVAAAAGVDPGRRPEQLAVADFRRLAAVLGGKELR